MKTVKLITCDDAFQAHVIQGALKNEGIASVLHNENMSSVMRGYVRDVREWIYLFMKMNMTMPSVCLNGTR